MTENNDTSFLHRLIQWLKPFFVGCIQIDEETSFPDLEAGTSTSTQELEREYIHVKQHFETKIQRRWKHQYNRVLSDMHTYWRIEQCKRRIIDELHIRTQRKKLLDELKNRSQLQEEYVLVFV